MLPQAKESLGLPRARRGQEGSKKRNEVFYLDLLSNILDVSYALFHLIKNKEHSHYVDE